MTRQELLTDQLAATSSLFSKCDGMPWLVSTWQAKAKCFWGCMQLLGHALYNRIVRMK